MKNKKIILLLGIIVVFIGAVLIGLLFKTNGAEEKIVGEWLRTDGPYTIKVIELLPEGKLNTKYLNPNKINVGRAAWRVEDDVIQIYVELRDENYPGSIYQLEFDEDNEQLCGTYYQAVSRQTFEVYFKKVK